MSDNEWVPRLARSFGLATLIWALATTGAAAATLEPVGAFEQPIFVTSDPSDPGRLFVTERAGRVVEVRGGKATPYADLTSLVSCCQSERGLLSIALPADFARSGRFYAAYTGKAASGGAEGDIHVDAFTPTGAGTVARQPIISVEHSSQPNHNGGQLQFGPDGQLYISTGDGGGGGDPLESGQSVTTLLGKVLRIDPLPGATPPYSIPPGNPFATGPGLDEIWSYGLRNPWRFSFDRLSGDMVIADVGQGMREEVDHALSPGPGAVGGAGANYGWNCREGFGAYPEAPAACGGAVGFTEPVFDYPHLDPMDGSAHGCSITGGYVVRDPSLGDLYGRYLYADFCVGEIRSVALPAVAGGRAIGDRSEGLQVASPVSFGEDSCGRLYVVSGDEIVYRLVGATAATCSPSATTSSSVLPPTQKHRRARLRIKAKRVGSRGARIVIRLTPCTGNGGEKVRLNRGGELLAVRRLDRHCVARLFTRLTGRATFRALLPDPPIRSRRLAIEARPGPS